MIKGIYDQKERTKYNVYTVTHCDIHVIPARIEEGMNGCREQTNGEATLIERESRNVWDTLYNQLYLGLDLMVRSIERTILVLLIEKVMLYYTENNRGIYR